jgi:hypothetical protein
MEEERGVLNQAETITNQPRRPAGSVDQTGWAGTLPPR